MNSFGIDSELRYTVVKKTILLIDVDSSTSVLAFKPKKEDFMQHPFACSCSFRIYDKRVKLCKLCLTTVSLAAENAYDEKNSAGKKIGNVITFTVKTEYEATVSHVAENAVYDEKTMQQSKNRECNKLYRWNKTEHEMSRHFLCTLETLLTDSTGGCCWQENKINGIICTDIMCWVGPVKPGFSGQTQSLCFMDKLSANSSLMPDDGKMKRNGFFVHRMVRQS